MPYSDPMRRLAYQEAYRAAKRAGKPLLAGVIARATSARIPRTEADLAWVAGILEGEGCIRINKPTKRNRGALCVQVTNTDPDVLATFQRLWPASQCVQRIAKAHHRPAWNWITAARAAAAFLQEVRPFLRTARMREKTDLALEFQAQKSSDHRVNCGEQYLTRQDEYYERMKALNAKGRAGPVRDASILDCKEAPLFRRVK